MESVLAINLLIRLGVAAAIAAVLVRSRTFKNLLFTEQRTFAQNMQLVLFVGIPFALGVLIRLKTPNFVAADLGFEAALLLGVMLGPAGGMIAGGLLALPAIMGGELLTLPFNVLAGVLAGILRELAGDREAIWSFSPFIDLSIYRWIRRNFPRPQLNWQISFFLVILALRFLQGFLQRNFPGEIFALDRRSWPMLLAVYAGTVMAVATPLKIWHNTRMEMKLEEQQRLLLQARMEALQSQINPHFLFNTLNSVSSLVRFDPDTARDLIVKLANILRRLLRSGEAFVQLQEEVRFIDDYLDIEVVRFGRDKLRVIKELEPSSLDVMVPSMLLQPLVENSVKHGLSPKIEGGTIHLRSRLEGGDLLVEVEDDGVGMGAASFLEKPTGMGGSGIGIANVAERIKVLYGDSGSLVINAGRSGGTLVRLRLPLLGSTERSFYAEARSSTSR